MELTMCTSSTYVATLSSYLINFSQLLFAQIKLPLLKVFKTQTSETAEKQNSVAKA